MKAPRVAYARGALFQPDLADSRWEPARVNLGEDAGRGAGAPSGRPCFTQP